MENQNLNSIEEEKIETDNEQINNQPKTLEERQEEIEKQKQIIRNRPPKKFTKKDLIRNAILYGIVAVIAFVVYYFVGPFKSISPVANAFIAFGVCVFAGAYSSAIEYWLAKKSRKKEDR